MRRTDRVSRGGTGPLAGLCPLIVLGALLAGDFRARAAEPDGVPEVHAGRGAAGTSTRPRPVAGMASSKAEIPLDLPGLARIGGNLLRSGLGWYRRTPPADRVCQGGLAACAWLGFVVLLERTLRLRARKIVPPDFTERFLDRLHEGRLDGGKALDYCEMNPSPAARVALAAVRRWGRPAADLERAVALAHRVESERLKVNVGTLRRIAALAPLLGVLGTLLALGRVLEMLPGDGPGALPWGRALASALVPLTAGIAVGTLALVGYDMLLARVERLTGALDRLGAETIDAIAMTTPPAVPSLLASPLHARSNDHKTHHQHAPHRRLIDDEGSRRIGEAREAGHGR